MFKEKGFTPVHVNAGAFAPRLFAYSNTDDLLKEVMAPGYFNKKRIIMSPNAFIKIICKDAIVEAIVDTNTGEVTMKDAFFRATKPVSIKKTGGE